MLSAKCNSSRCEYLLPDWIKYEDCKYFYLDPNNSNYGNNWKEAKDLKDAERSSSNGNKIHWMLCPYYAYSNGHKGKKYVPRNHVDLLRSYLKSNFPGMINLREGEDIDTIHMIWITSKGYYSYKVYEDQKKNLERNCTNGYNCSGRKNGKCPYNHYYDDSLGTTSNPCPNDFCSETGRMLEKSFCTYIDCEKDHSINRVDWINTCCQDRKIDDKMHCPVAVPMDISKGVISDTSIFMRNSVISITGITEMITENYNTIHTLIEDNYNLYLKLLPLIYDDKRLVDKNMSYEQFIECVKHLHPLVKNQLREQEAILGSYNSSRKSYIEMGEFNIQHLSHSERSAFTSISLKEEIKNKPELDNKSVDDYPSNVEVQLSPKDGDRYFFDIRNSVSVF